MNRGVDKKLEAYKARIITKDNSLKLSFDYEETLFSVIMLKSIIIILFIIVHLDYEI